MQAAGWPGGLPLNFRFSPAFAGRSPASRWGTLILVSLSPILTGSCAFFPVKISWQPPFKKKIVNGLLSALGKNYTPSICGVIGLKRVNVCLEMWKLK